MDRDTYLRMQPIFVDETGRCLAEMDEALLLLTNEPENREARLAIARSAHTIAGNAAAMGYHAMLPVAQCIELTATPGECAELPPNRLRTLINSRNTLRGLLDDVCRAPERLSA